MLAARLAQSELRVPEVCWGPPVLQGRMEPLGQPVVSVRTARRVRWGQPEPPVQSERQGRKEPLEQ